MIMSSTAVNMGIAAVNMGKDPSVCSDQC